MLILVYFTIILVSFVLECIAIELFNENCVELIKVTHLCLLKHTPKSRSNRNVKTSVVLVHIFLNLNNIKLSFLVCISLRNGTSKTANMQKSSSEIMAFKTQHTIFQEKPANNSIASHQI